MIINIIILSIVLLSVIEIFLLLWFKLFPLLERFIEVKDKETKNEKYKIFMNISPELMQTSLDQYFESYVNRYITYKFIAKKSMYIKQEEIETMVRDLTKLIYIQISELYVFYISMTRSINDDDSLLEYIHTKVENTCIEAVSSFNGSMSN